MVIPQLKERSCSPTPSSIPGTVCRSCSSTRVLPSTGILLVHRPELGTTLSFLFSVSTSLTENKMPKQGRETKLSAGLQSSVLFC